MLTVKRAFTHISPVLPSSEFNPLGRSTAMTGHPAPLIQSTAFLEAPLMFP
ncbi:MAG TPA: hypothetical protein VJO14_00205 [Bacteroidota bacterium]|nr:hypothetical protein [Bacteroidota bacterium]